MRTLFFLFFLIPICALAQPRTAIVTGVVINEENRPLSGVSITILGKQTGVMSSDSGTFSISVPAKQAVALLFTHTSYQTQQKNFFLSAGEQETVRIMLTTAAREMEGVTVTDSRSRTEPGLISVNPKNAIALPSATGGVEALIKTMVGSNNELTQQYNVRGGNFDENLIYINGFEVYRPYLVSSGQQEGLSIINPEMVRNIQFYTGGFGAMYGDRMSSILNITYKQPRQFGGSAYIGLLEQGFHLEGNTRNKRFSFLTGVRNKSNRNLLSSQPVTGVYLPAASDVQALIKYRLSEKLDVELLGIYNTSRFEYFPESVQKTSSVFSPFYTANLGIDIYFEGQEKDRYQTALAGLTLKHNISNRLNLQWMAGYFYNREKENFDIGSAYLFGDRDFDRNSATFGQIINPLAAGYYQDYARNELQIKNLSFQHRGTLKTGRMVWLWGAGWENSAIEDKLNQWQYMDSAGYSLPYNPGSMQMYAVFRGESDFSINRYHGFLQNNFLINKGAAQFTISSGVRVQYNDLNEEVLVSPRLQTSFKPGWKKDIVFKLAGGLYHQPPFYREMRNTKSELNTQVKAQKSAQVILGADYAFTGPGNRPMRFTAEAYYKHMWDVNPYDIDNVRIRYHGHNNAKAYATGMEFRLFGELLKDAESWVSLGFMRTREDLENDHYYRYYNAAGELIKWETTDKVVADSVRSNMGYVRRPTDRLITMGLFLQDYLSTNKNFRIHFQLLYGSNMPFNIPNSVRHRNALKIPPYIRADVGFSVLLLKEKSLRRSHDPFRGLESAWLSVEVFNLINRHNTISYQLIRDFTNTTYTLPNRLTPRLLNIKLLTRF